MATNPNWLLGKHLKTLYIYTGARDVDTGIVTWSGTPAKLKDGSTIQSLADYVRVSDDRVLDMIVPVDALYAHYEKTLMDFTLTVGEILAKGGQPILPGLAQANDLIKVVFARGTTTLQTYTFYGIIRTFQDGVSSVGKNTCEMVLAPFFDGTNIPLALS